MIACGALGAHLREIVSRRGWPVELHCLPALLHNRPAQIASHAERLARRALARGARVVLAGSFGSYLSPANAIRLGLVPEIGVLRVVSAGNVAGEGAKRALLSLRERAAGLALLEEVRYVELSDRADFNDRFVAQLPFPG